MTMTMIFSDKSRKRLRFGICSTEVTCKMAQNLRPAQHTNTKPNLLIVPPFSVHQQQSPLLSTVDLTSHIYLLSDQEEASATSYFSQHY